MLQTDICIAGAGIIGLSLALELQATGFNVIVVEAGEPLREASTAAAGMLAAHDPHNPPALSALAQLSIELYPIFLDRLRSLGGVVPFQTTHTLQSLRTPPEAMDPLSMCSPNASAPLSLSGYQLLEENSIDPRQLAPALLAAVRATSIRILSMTSVIATSNTADHVLIDTPSTQIQAAHFIDCTGAWARSSLYKVVPIKGQMLAVRLPSAFPLAITVRTPDIYIVPRTIGPGAGCAIIGATIEDAGFDKTVHAAQIEDLRQQAIALLPPLRHAEIVESWSGLRPATADRLPILGADPVRPRHFVATGHFRNGILLAPATAHVMAQLIRGQAPSVALAAFDLARPSIAHSAATLTRSTT